MKHGTIILYPKDLFPLWVATHYSFGQNLINIWIKYFVHCFTEHPSVFNWGSEQLIKPSVPYITTVLESLLDQARSYPKGWREVKNTPAFQQQYH